MANYITAKQYVKDEKVILIPEHAANDLLIIYRKELSGAAAIPHIQGWDNQSFMDRGGNHHVISWVIDRLGTIDEVDNDTPKPYDAFLTIYRGVTVGEISIDDMTRYDPGPVLDSDAEVTHRAPDAVLKLGTSRVNMLVLPEKFYQRVVVDFKFKSNNYFATSNSSGGHIAVVVRCDQTMIDRAVRGHGLTLGSVVGAPAAFGDPAYAANPISPSTQIETWCNAIRPGVDMYLLNGNPGPPVLRDGVVYDVRIETFVAYDRTTQTVRYTLHTGGALLYDSGVVIDPNRFFNPAHNSLVVGHVFSSPSNDWTVDITDVVQRMSN